MTFGIQRALAFDIFPDAHEAAKAGHTYTRPSFLPIEIEKAIVIKNGTETGLSSVDLILVDENGQHYVMMITGRLLQMLAGASV